MPSTDEAGLTTAELLGNAALGVLALVAIWALDAAARCRHRRVDPRPAHRVKRCRIGASRPCSTSRPSGCRWCSSCCSRTCSSTCTPVEPSATRSTKAYAPSAPAGTDATRVRSARRTEVLDGLLRGRLGDDIRDRVPARGLDDGRARGRKPAVVAARARSSLGRDVRSADAARAMSERREQRDERGFVAVEWVAAIAVLMLPVVVLVATLPNWAERRHAATVAAREAAAVAVVNAMVDPAAAQRVASRGRGELRHRRVATSTFASVPARHGASTSPSTSASACRRSRCRASCTPEAWTYTATQHRRLDDYRSR